MQPICTSRDVLHDNYGAFTQTERGPMTPRTRARVQRRVCLRGTLRAMNYVLILYGAVMVSWDFFTYIQWSQAMYRADEAGAPTSSALQRQPIQRASRAFQLDRSASSIRDVYSIFSIDDDSLQQSGARGAETGRIRSNQQTTLQYAKLGERGYPAFLVVFGALGVLLFTTACVGVLSADLAACGVSLFVFGCYHALMMVLIILQLAALVFYYTNKTHMQGSSSHTGGKSQEYQQLQEMMHTDLEKCSWATVAAVSLTLSTLVVSYRTHSAVCATRHRGRQLSISHPSNLLSRPVSSGPADSVALPASLSHSDDSTYSDCDPMEHVHRHCAGLERGEAYFMSKDLSLEVQRSCTGLEREHDSTNLERSDLQPKLPSNCELDIESHASERMPLAGWECSHSFKEDRHLQHHRNSDPLV